VLLNSDIRDGSLRGSAIEMGTKILVYEAGQALRFDEMSIRAGVKGVTNVLQSLGLIKKKRSTRAVTPFVANNSAWVRSGDSGIVNDFKRLGDHVQKGDLLATVGSPFGEVIDEIRASRSGIVIGKQNIPLVQEGDAMFHIAFFSSDNSEVADNVETLQNSLMDQNEIRPSEEANI
jgi:predicted deacylase